MSVRLRRSATSSAGVLAIVMGVLSLASIALAGQAQTTSDPEIRALDLTGGEKQALLAFLRSLSGTIRDGL